ncbi:hypothetical protein LJR013_003597 [Pseudarthrobacter oxydans]|uniref:hypothetical protein n=1 Tax=Pseudarthrobacter oxydans TaxID=1671 RepID=UPI003ECD598D
MNRLIRFILASSAGLTLAVTASPALAAPGSEPGSNSAQVEHVESGSPDGTFTSEYRAATRNVEGHYTTNARDQLTIAGSSFDDKTHYTVTDTVTKLSSQSTVTEDGGTCRTNSQNVVIKGETRWESSRSTC